MSIFRFDTTSPYHLFHAGYVQVVRNENYNYEYKKGKDRYSLIYVETGSLHYTFSDNEITLQQGDFIFIPKNLPYKTVYLKNATKIQILLFDLRDATLPFPIEQPFFQSNPNIQQTFSSFTDQTNTNTLFLISKIYEILYFLQNSNNAIPKKYKKIAPAIQELKYHYIENHKIKFYADLCHMSESNFRKLFKEYTGHALIEYRNFIRYNAVKKMLDSGEFTVAEAAYLAGFNNMSFFYEVLHKYSR